MKSNDFHVQVVYHFFGSCLQSTLLDNMDEANKMVFRFLSKFGYAF